MRRLFLPTFLRGRGRPKCVLPGLCAPAARMGQNLPRLGANYSLSAAQNQQPWGLSLQVDALNPTIEIVAVQGLGANAEYTWLSREPTPKRWKPINSLFKSSEEAEDDTPMRVMWLKDLLPQHIPDARIATYSYPSEWFGAGTGIKTSFRECGEQLLNVLKSDRQARKATKRPILFIGHSMGGLVVKQALVIAATQHPDYDDIRHSTAGVIFLGTPHGGSSSAVYGEWIARVFGKDTDLLESLKPKSSELFAMSRDFDAGYRKLPIISYYEKRQTKLGHGLKTQFVDQESGTLSGSQIIFLDTDHSGLNKFSGEDDTNFQHVLQGIKAMAITAPDIVRKNFQEVGREKPKPCSMVPFERDSRFIGRGDIIDQVDEKFRNQRRVALVGLGGIGKSQIAIEYSYQFRERHPESWVFWVHSSSPARFEQAYSEIARKLNLPGHDDPNTNTLQLLHEWLKDENNGKWLLVLDNADDTDVFFTGSSEKYPEAKSQNVAPLAAYLPQTPHGSILVTSRNKLAAFKLTDHNIIEVPSLHRDDAIALLRKRLPDDKSSDEDVASLVEKLECLPLAVTQAAAYIAVRATRMTISRYLAIFLQNEANQSTLLKGDMGDLRRDSSVPNSVLTTWQISFDQIKQSNTGAAELLSLISVLDYQGIPEFILYNEENRLAFEDYLAPLVDFSLVITEIGGQSLQIHRLVQLATRTWLSTNGEIDKWKMEALKLISESFPVGLHESWKECSALFPHTEIVLQYPCFNETQYLQKAKILYNSAWYLHELGKLKGAVERIGKALDIHRQYLGEKDVTFFNSLNLQGLILCSVGEFTAAEEVQKQAVDGFLKLLGSEHPDTLVSMSNLSLTLCRLGDYGTAQELQQLVLTASEKVLGPEHRDTLASANNLASVLQDQGNYKAAEILLRRVLVAKQRDPGPSHPETWKTVSNLAKTLNAQGHYAEAEQLDRQVLFARERIIGLEHPDTLVSLNNLAENLHGQGHYAEAEQLNRQALVARGRTLGLEHPETLNSLSNLAMNLHRQGHYAEAEQLNRQALVANERILGLEHPETLTSLNNLASTLDSQCRYEEAEQLNRRVSVATERIWGHEHPKTLTSLNNLAANLLSLRRYEEAEQLSRRVSVAHERILGPDHPHTLMSLNNLAFTLHSRGLSKEAEQLDRRVLAARVRVLGLEHPDTMLSLHNLAAYLHQQGSFTEAKQLGRRALTAMEKNLGHNYPDTLRSAYLLGSSLWYEAKFGEGRQPTGQAWPGKEKLERFEQAATPTSFWAAAGEVELRGNYFEALYYLRWAYEGFEQTFGSEHSETVICSKKFFSSIDEILRMDDVQDKKN